MHTREEQLAAFGRLLNVMDTLREKCPWDRKQTFDSLRQNTIEEVFELATAISRRVLRQNGERDEPIRHCGCMQPAVR